MFWPFRTSKDARTHEEEHRGLYHSQIWIVVILNLLILLFSSFVEAMRFFALSGVGLVTFFGVLLITNTASEDKKFSTGEMRKAITSSVLIFYILVVSLFLSSKINDDLSSQIVENFLVPLSWLLGSISAFYFGDAALNRFLEVRQSSQPDSGTVSQPDSGTVSQPDSGTVSQPDSGTVSQSN